VPRTEGCFPLRSPSPRTALAPAPGPGPRSGPGPRFLQSPGPYPLTRISRPFFPATPPASPLSSLPSIARLYFSAPPGIPRHCSGSLLPRMFRVPVTPHPRRRPVLRLCPALRSRRMPHPRLTPRLRFHTAFCVASSLRWARHAAPSARLPKFVRIWPGARDCCARYAAISVEALR
jgi:hypothetical protein